MDQMGRQSPAAWARALGAATLALACAATVAGTARPGGEPGWSWLMESASAKQQVDWGQRYEHGEGVAKSLRKAAALYCKAAEKGDALAQYNLGWIYANGRGTPRDDALAVAWLQKAAAQGDPRPRAGCPRTAAASAVPASTWRASRRSTARTARPSSRPSASWRRASVSTPRSCWQ